MIHPFFKTARISMTLALVMGSGAAARAQQNPPIPTMDDLHAMYVQKSYRVCLQQIYRVMNLRADLAKGYDRGELFWLRGNCLLAQRDRDSAMIAFKSAGDAASTNDMKIMARAMRVLLTACPGLTYQPTDRSQKAIDVIDEGERKKAMLALMNDRYGAVAADVVKAQDATSLVPLQAVVPKVLDLAALEKTANGALAQTMPLGRALGDRARELINKELEAVGTRDTNIQQLASTNIYNGNAQIIGPDGSKWWDGVERRGLSTDDRNTLRADIDYLGRIQETVNAAAQIALIYTGSAERWEPTITLAAQAMTVATSTLDSE